MANIHHCRYGINPISDIRNYAYIGGARNAHHGASNDITAPGCMLDDDQSSWPRLRRSDQEDTTH